MKVRIDYDLCMGDGNCHKVCPEVFGYDEEKFQGIVLQADVPRQFQARVRQAAEECNPGAIEIED